MARRGHEMSTSVDMHSCNASRYRVRGYHRSPARRWPCLAVVLALLGGLLAEGAGAEPYLAVETGYHCSQCHRSPTGGGMRSEFGNLFAATQLPLLPSADDSLWSGQLGDFLAVGGNLRVGGSERTVSGQDTAFEFDVQRATLYAAAEVNEFVSVYVDEQVAPGSASNREAWIQFEHAGWYLRAGKLFLPFGWRLEDDSAFIREVTGINFNSGDNGVEFGLEKGPWSLQTAFSNGTAGAPEVDDGKQVSFRAVHVRPLGRLGVSYNYNDTDSGERTMYGLFAGLRTGPVSWLAEYDRIEDDGFGLGQSARDVGLLEANLRLARGNYLKLTAEILDDERESGEDWRYSVVYEVFPLPFTQLRLGYRDRRSDTDVPQRNGEEYFLQLHAFF